MGLIGLTTLGGGVEEEANKILMDVCALELESVNWLPLRGDLPLLSHRKQMRPFPLPASHLSCQYTLTHGKMLRENSQRWYTVAFLQNRNKKNERYKETLHWRTVLDYDNCLSILFLTLNIIIVSSFYITSLFFQSKLFLSGIQMLNIQKTNGR